MGSLLNRGAITDRLTILWDLFWKRGETPLSSPGNNCPSPTKVYGALQAQCLAHNGLKHEGREHNRSNTSWQYFNPWEVACHLICWLDHNNSDNQVLILTITLKRTFLLNSYLACHRVKAICKQSRCCHCAKHNIDFKRLSCKTQYSLE